MWPICSALWDKGYHTETVDSYVEKDYVWTLYIDDASQERKMIAYAAVHRVGSRDLLREFHDSAIASHIRDAADGGIACIGFLYADDMAGIANVSQIIITEILTELIARDFAYAVYHPVDRPAMKRRSSTPCAARASSTLLRRGNSRFTPSI